MQYGDNLVMVLLIVASVFWGGYYVRKWLLKPPTLRLSVRPDSEIVVTDAVALLEESGFEVLTQKRKVSIRITVNEEDELQSRLFVDHFASREDGVYVVKVARERKPLDMTGSGVRDHLLVYHLLYPDAAGIVYVDPLLRTIHTYRFHIQGEVSIR
ncbi:hypothetical protein [Paenibacillus cymbidii]|uniref:hypothetical protein n=1 Tax=Paenibacillus cymbidii TaxID=1639034 RepID=UPI001A9A8921|nr:hypothetical protein [Paenibacillus cymbidii]